MDPTVLALLRYVRARARARVPEPLGRVGSARKARLGRRRPSYDASVGVDDGALVAAAVPRGTTATSTFRGEPVLQLR